MRLPRWLAPWRWFRRRPAAPGQVLDVRLSLATVFYHPRFRKENFMSIVATWTNPPNRADGTPSDPNDVVLLGIAAMPTPPVDPSTLTYSPVGQSTAGAATATITANPSPGNYALSFTVQDSQTPPRQGAPVFGPTFNVPTPVLAAPGQVSNVSVAVQ